ncbi:MAG: sulfur carrier protein ThiS [Phycisphaerales bacterium]|nr:sulfur carrier protein ThiS [Phycisphaerales bacterium]
MRVTVNGETRELPPNATVRTLIETLGLAGKACAAEVNAELVPFRKHPETTLKEGDRVEIVTLVGGG